MNLETKKTTKTNLISRLNLSKIQLKKIRDFKITLKYIIEQLIYLFVILFASIIIQSMWNFLAVKLFDGEYQISTFEAAVLWICIY